MHCVNNVIHLLFTLFFCVIHYCEYEVGHGRSYVFERRIVLNERSAVAVVTAVGRVARIVKNLCTFGFALQAASVSSAVFSNLTIIGDSAVAAFGVSNCEGSPHYN